MDINGVEFWEDNQDPRSPSYQFALDDSRIRRSLQLRPQDAGSAVDEELRFAAATALLGHAEVATVDGHRHILRTLPHAYPVPETVTNPGGASFIYATSIPRMDPIAPHPDSVDALKRALYQAYRLEVHYTPLPYFILPDEGVLALAGPLESYPDEGDCLERGWRENSRFVSKQVKGASRTVSLRQGQLKYSAGAGADAGVAAANIMEGFAFTHSRTLIVYTWHLVPLEALPETAIQLALNCTNSDAFDGYPAGTLLFMDYDFVRHEGPLGDKLCDVVYRMMFMPNYDMVSEEFRGWNSLPRVIGAPGSEKRRYWAMSSDGDPPDLEALGGVDNAQYPGADFSSLFRPDQP